MKVAWNYYTVSYIRILFFSAIYIFNQGKLNAVRYKDLLDDVYLDISKLIKSTESACSIIYCLERSACDELSAYLAKKGISCAGMKKCFRIKNQNLIERTFYEILF